MSQGTYGPIRDAHIRTAFSRATSDHPIDELVLICGERGCGRAIIDHLKGKQRLLFASVVPGSVRAVVTPDRVASGVGASDVI